jgi:hypothetical protein
VSIPILFLAAGLRLLKQKRNPGPGHSSRKAQRQAGIPGLTIDFDSFFGMTFQDAPILMGYIDWSGAFRADDVASAIRPQDARVGHQQHGIGQWDSAVAAQPFQAGGAA